ncbi:DUF6795 domain-containing protein [Marinimicrobium agarilyticum]|uniref:DUF6795 domain-containing protein n=1 Tax=Marinimicrobium agarilyticum TaxID=306546 RepID=UPI0004899B4B|nr:DUF6795 domain-containing protein [Marinimicrobium agarilyticum]
MSLFFGGDKSEIVIFSPLDGRLLYKGEPVSNADIKLWIKWKDTKGESFHYKTDEKGYFSIPKKTDLYKDSPLAQLVITQEITVEYKGESHLIWTLSKTDGRLNVEFGGEPKNLICELAEDLNTIRTDEVLMGTRCNWEI